MTVKSHPRPSRRCVAVVADEARRDAYFNSGYWTRDTLPDRLRHAAVTRPEALAVVDLLGSRRRSYGELQGDVDRAAQLLTGLGAQPGEVIAVQLPNWYETVVFDLAVLSLSCTLNAMLPIYRARELRHMLTVAQTRILITPRTYRGFAHDEMVANLRDVVPSLQHHVVVPDPTTDGGALDALLAGYAPEPVGVVLEAEDVSELMFTSGTEAAPKAIMHTEATTNFAARAAGTTLGLTDNDVVWMPSPIGHSTGFNFGVRVAIYHGLPLVLQDQWKAADAVSLVSANACSYTVAATTFLADMVAEAAASNTDVSCMRLFSSGGAAVPAALVEEAAAAGITVLRLYGSTEILIGSWNRPTSPVAKRIDTDGVPFDGVELQIRGEDDAVTDGPGEIFVRSPSTCVGFFDDPARTGATFGTDGWVSTGDLGVLDAEGYLTIVGRKKEIIIRGGLNIAPREVEDLILTLPGVVAAAVIGLPHARLGEIGCACVVLADGFRLTQEQLVGSLRAYGLAAYKLPERLVVVDTLPTTLTGKVQKHILRDYVDSLS